MSLVRSLLGGQLPDDNGKGISERAFFIFMSTSRLQCRVSELLSIYLGQYTIRENIRPDWLVTHDGNRLELDFLIEEINTAIEVQGQQHYNFSPFFHSDKDGYKKRLEWDRLKVELCNSRGINLFAVDNEQDAILLIEKLSGKASDEEGTPPITGQEIYRAERDPRHSVTEDQITVLENLKSKTEIYGDSQKSKRKVKEILRNKYILRKISALGMNDLAEWVIRMSA